MLIIRILSIRDWAFMRTISLLLPVLALAANVGLRACK
jgi:hypothetical protein